MADPASWRVVVTYLDEQGNPQTWEGGHDTRIDAIERINEVLVDGSYYPEGATFQKVTFYEPNVV